jgi:hypothetical protein
MKDSILSFLKPRPWTVIFALFLVAWQYLYAFRGVDFEYISNIRSYFGFGLSAINWNNFMVRTLSMALIWIIVAGVIFFGLWLAEMYVVSAHNRKISKNYINQPKENYAHLLKTRDVSFKKHFVAQIWLSAFIICIPLGMFLVTGLVESLRSSVVIYFLTSAQDSGMELDYNSVSIVVTSFLFTVPVWYLYGCFDSWLLVRSREGSAAAQIADDHYAVPVEDFAEVSEDDDEADEPEPQPPVAPVV